MYVRTHKHTHAHALTLAAMHPNARIDSNPIHAFPSVAFMRQIEKIRCNLVFSLLAKFNATQRKALRQYCEPAFRLTNQILHHHTHWWGRIATMYHLKLNKSWTEVGMHME